MSWVSCFYTRRLMVLATLFAVLSATEGGLRGAEPDEANPQSPGSVEIAAPSALYADTPLPATIPPLSVLKAPAPLAAKPPASSPPGKSLPLPANPVFVLPPPRAGSGLSFVPAARSADVFGAAVAAPSIPATITFHLPGTPGRAGAPAKDELFAALFDFFPASGGDAGAPREMGGALSQRRADDDRWLAERLERVLSSPEANRARAETGLALCGERATTATEPEEVERWLLRARDHWNRARPGSGAEAFAAWAAEREPKGFPPPWRALLRARLFGDELNGYRDPLVGFLDDPAWKECHADLLLTLAALDLRAERPEGADWLRRLLLDHPASPAAPKAMMLLAWHELMQDNLDTARDLLRRLLEQHPGDPLAQRARGMLAGLEARTRSAAAPTAPVSATDDAPSMVTDVF